MSRTTTLSASSGQPRKSPLRVAGLPGPSLRTSGHRRDARLDPPSRGDLLAVTGGGHGKTFWGGLDEAERKNLARRRRSNAQARAA